MSESGIFAGLNDDQTSAVEAVLGPVCILAGAGSGKTTTITRRIANQVASGTFRPEEILAVTFTDKAAGEMRARLEALGVRGVRARTFHSAALAQLRHLSPEPPGQILPSKVLALRKIANNLPKPYKFRPAADLATEVEWAKNRRISPAEYLNALGDHQPPIPSDLMVRVYERYERGKSDQGLIDFEDLLELTIRLYQSDEWAHERFTGKYRAFTVDEYQDTNDLQEALLTEWLGGRDELCVVGDDYQSIYGFTGASPNHLLSMPQRFHNTKVIRLESNYRSTPQVLSVANKLVDKLGGAEKVLRATRDEGPEPMLRPFRASEAECTFIVERIRALAEEGVPLEEMAILYRVNFRSEDYEEALSDAGIPYQVRDGAFLTRMTARQMLSSLKRSSSTSVASEVIKLAERAGYLEDPPDDIGEQELTRQGDLKRFVSLAEEFDDGVRTCIDFGADIAARFGTEGEGRGVNLLTYHRAKGLEFQAVFLPRAEEGELPIRRARTPDAIAEERRLFYVGITRAKTHLVISWVGDGKRKLSSFISEMQPKTTSTRSARPAREPEKTIPAKAGLYVELSGGYAGVIVEVLDFGAVVALENGGDMSVPFGSRVTCEGETLPLGPASPEDVLGELKKWRKERAQADEVPAYVVFHDKTLQDIAEHRPASLDELASISGVGPAKLDRYGNELLTVLGGGAG